MDTQLLKRAFSVDEFHRMGEAGVFGEDDRLELLDGEIVRMTPIGSPHAGCVNRLNSLLTAALGPQAIVSVQNPVICSDRTELQPDLAILKARTDFYSHAHPRPQDVYALFEVADSSIRYDQGVKLQAYALAGIPALVIIDLRTRVVTVYRTPTSGTYRQEGVLRLADTLQIPGLQAVSMSVGDLFD
jgi:Uma2 family endonuclease